MKFKRDENLPGEGVQILRAAGHDAVTVLDQRMGGKPDPGRPSCLPPSPKSRRRQSIATPPPPGPKGEGPDD